MGMIENMARAPGLAIGSITYLAAFAATIAGYNMLPIGMIVFLLGMAYDLATTTEHFQLMR